MKRFLMASLVTLLTVASIAPSFAGPRHGGSGGYVVAGRCAPPPDGCPQ